MSLRHLPNILSGLRILLIAPIVFALLDDQFGIALVIFFISGLSDAVDGYLARRFQWQSRLGGVLDPVADKLLLVSCFVTLGVLSILPWWLVIAALIRDLIILLGATAFHFLIGRVEMEPLHISKLNTVLQLSVIFFAVLAQVWDSIPYWLVAALIYATLLTTISSGLAYVYVWGKKAAKHTARLQNQ
jgi:cardiolipin synthase